MYMYVYINVQTPSTGYSTHSHNSWAQLSSHVVC